MSLDCVIYTVHVTAFCLGGPFFPNTVYILLHFINFDSSVLSKAGLKDDNGRKFVSGGKLFHALMIHCIKKLLRTLLLVWDLNNLYA